MKRRLNVFFPQRPFCVVHILERMCLGPIVLDYLPVAHIMLLDWIRLFTAAKSTAPLVKHLASRALFRQGSLNGIDLITGLTNAGLLFHDVIFHEWNFQESEICKMDYLHDDNFAGWQQCRNVKLHEFQYARMISARGQDSRLLISKDVESMNPRFSASSGTKIDPLSRAPY